MTTAAIITGGGAARRSRTVTRAAWTLLGAARDLPTHVVELASALHEQECGCEQLPDEITVGRASALVQAGWRPTARLPGGDLVIRLSELLAEIARAWQEATTQPISTAEALRWSGVCALAYRIAEGVRQ